MTIEIDFSEYDDDDLSTLSQKIAVERERRSLLANAQNRLAELQMEVLNARDGVSDPDTPRPWVEPTSPTDAYPKGWPVEKEGGVYRSLEHSNTYTPYAGSEHWETVQVEEEA